MDSSLRQVAGPPRPSSGPNVDSISGRYSALAEDSSLSEQARQAATRMAMAEAHLLGQGDAESALKLAKEAFDSYSSSGDKVAQADAMRLMAHAQRLQADFVVYDGGSSAENQAADLYDAIEKQVKEQLKAFKDASDARGQGAMTLALAEIADDRRNKYDPDELRDVLRLAQQAKSLLVEGGDKKLEGLADLLIATTQYRRFEKEAAATAVEAALKNFQLVGDRKLEAKALHLIAYGYIVRNDLEEGIRIASDALSMFREEESRYLEAFECFAMAEYFLYFRKGRDALPYAEDALDIYREVEFCRGWQAHCLDAMVQALLFRGEDRKALNTARESVELFEAKNDRRQLGVAYHSLVQAYMAQSDYQNALKAVEEEHSCVQDIGDQRWEANVNLDMATVHMSAGNMDQATEAANEALELFQAMKDRQGEAFAMNKMNEVSLANMDDDAVMQTAVEQRAIFQELEDKSRAATCQLTIAGLTAAEGRFDEAMGLAEEAQEWFQEAQDKEGEARALNFMAQFLCDEKDAEGAIDKAKEMRECLRDFGSKVLEANACRVLCDIHLAFDKPEDALRSAREGLTLVKKAMDKREIVEYNLLVASASMAMIEKEVGAGAAKGIEKALRPAKDALTIAKSLTKGGRNSLMAQALHTISLAQMMAARIPEAMTAAKEAAEIFKGSGQKAEEAASVLQIANIHYAAGMQEKALEAAQEALALAKEAQASDTEKRASELVEKIQGKPKLSIEAVGGQMPAGALMAPADGGAAGGAAAAPGAAESVAQASKGLDPEEVLHAVQEMAKAAIGLDEELLVDSPLMDSGMDSLTAVSFRNGLQQNLGVKLPSSLMFDYPTMKEVANRIVELSLEDE
mmetsp:Transcript_88340/g.184613  ORF Transcript_88340/g.184613 Transcript_88340/m.184613 type:complete len:860 (+) Transcript_88340:248-2827(+)